MTAPKATRLEGRVRDIVQSGDAILETERGLVFARGALPGERVLCELDPKLKKPLRGRVIKVLSASPERVEVACAHARRCGGCPLMPMSLSGQRALKLGFLRAALEGAGVKADFPIAHVGAEQVLGYRRRARLAFQVARGARLVGYRRERSHALVDIPDCAVLHPTLSAALNSLREQILPELAGEGEIRLALGEGERAVSVISAREAQPPRLYAACEALCARGPFAGIALYAAGATAPAVFGAPTEWSSALDGRPLEGALGGFSQAHAEINRRLVERVRDLCAPEGKQVIELFAGHGNFSVALAKGAQKYLAVEQDARAVTALRRNLEARGLTAKVVEGDAFSYSIPTGFEVALLDPPRAGAPGLLTRLAERKLKRIVYVSCDPQTLARDLREVLDHGYRLSFAEVFEMFPQTADLECVVCLDRT